MHNWLHSEAGSCLVTHEEFGTTPLPHVTSVSCWGLHQWRGVAAWKWYHLHELDEGERASGLLQPSAVVDKQIEGTEWKKVCAWQTWLDRHDCMESKRGRQEENKSPWPTVWIPVIAVFLSREALSVKISVAETNPHPSLYFPGCLCF